MRRWQSIQPQLDALGVDFVAISPDTPQEVARLQQSGLVTLKLLSDAELTVIDRYNLRSHKTLAGAPGRSRIRFLAIPTTILVDAQGVVRWVDQATDNRVRSDPRRVIRAIRVALGYSM
ncbi:MAG: redoxin domain-containing protein [Alphaproteobacteria bacterium]|nr:redoxin domain-containing protein [Alphaproteobacteria bacterium]